VGGLLFLSFLLQRRAPQWMHEGFLSLSFFLLILHFTDFTMARILDAPLSYLFYFFFGQGISHILTSFHALNLNMGMILLSGSLLCVIPMTALFFYHLTARLCQKRPLRLSLFQISLPILSATLLLCLLHFLVSPQLNYPLFSQYQKSLPLGPLLLSYPKQQVALPAPLSLARNEPPLLPRLDLPSTPNLYLFVIETLRKDFITPEITPELARFAKENLSFLHSHANANSSQLSWFSIFHSDLPHHWLAMKETWQRGSLPLQLLKQAGYKIHVYSSADLSYFGLNQLLFGNTLSLPDTFESYSPDLAPYLRDQLAFQSFQRDLASPEGKQGNIFLFFLDSTHSEYHFPPDFPLKFKPIVPRIAYLTLTPEDIEPIKNRYRNSCAYVDSLMGQFFSTLRTHNLYDDAVIAITGDHGEEFLEEGALFHGTHLNAAQTHVPIFLKCQNNPWPLKTDTASHIDLFPSLLHYLTRSPPPSLFDGHSVFLKRPWPYRITMLQNGPGVPKDFAIENDRFRIVARFLPASDPQTTTQVEILSYEHIPQLNSSLAPKEFVETYCPDAFSLLVKKRCNE